ncbi:MAG: TonB-dependent receptor [Gammaproteobacteria bacterium]|nr:TonB-dependent receptor [Gammaproteobacteria bacterium]MDE2273498.1 TonB-dependent receptor [Gammaproteobacteria bacterium]
MKRIFVVLPLLAGALLVTVQTHAAETASIQPVPAATPAPTAATSEKATGIPETVHLGTVQVQGERLNVARDTLNPETGTSSYRFDVQSIATLPQGYNAPLQNVLLQAPGVAQDSFGQLHVRGDHADIQYRINGVILPEPISGFGDTLGTRFISRIDFLTGALPAQYGYRTAGIVNITTNDGLQQSGGTVDLYGGSHATIQPSVDYGATVGKLDYYVTGSYLQSDLGIESPMPSNPIHDYTEQSRAFGYASYLLDSDLRLSFIAGHALGNFQIPNSPGQQPFYQLQGVSDYPSAELNETQRDLDDYGIVSLQGIQDALNYQVALFSRYSSIDYRPDPIGDLIYNGVAAQVFRRNIATGVQEDTSYVLNDRHTLRWGLLVDQERTTSNNGSSVFPADAGGSQTSDVPFTIVDDTGKNGELYGAYLQDQWQTSERFTLNYGLRYDVSNGYMREDQLSPRLNFVYKLSETTSLHGGYSRYFTPPTLELIAPRDIALFQNTTNALPSNVNTDVRAERDNYYDLGVSHVLTPNWQMGVDGYYKDARNLLDEGQFGQALVFSPFNYARGRIWGVEFTTSYQQENLSFYFNLAYGRALGNQVVSGQYNFDAAELAYISDHYVHLDHDQTWTASGGVAYNRAGTRYSLDAIFGSGLRSGFANTGSLPFYAQFDASASRNFSLPRVGDITMRFVIVNLFDRVYQIRSGSGIGVGAPQYGPRRGFFLGLTKSF